MHVAVVQQAHLCPFVFVFVIHRYRKAFSCQRFLASLNFLIDFKEPSCRILLPSSVMSQVSIGTDDYSRATRYFTTRHWSRFKLAM